MKFLASISLFIGLALSTGARGTPTEWQRHTHRGYPYSVSMLGGPNVKLRFNEEARLFELWSKDGTELVRRIGIEITKVLNHDPEPGFENLGYTIEYLAAVHGERTEEKGRFSMILPRSSTDDGIPVHFFSGAPDGGPDVLVLSLDDPVVMGNSGILVEFLEFTVNHDALELLGHRVSLAGYSNPVAKIAPARETSDRFRLALVSSPRSTPEVIDLTRIFKSGFVDVHYGAHGLEHDTDVLHYNPKTLQIEIAPPPPLTQFYPIYSLNVSRLGIPSADETNAHDAVDSDQSAFYLPQFNRSLKRPSEHLFGRWHWQGLSSILDEFGGEDPNFSFNPSHFDEWNEPLSKSTIKILLLPPAWQPHHSRHPLIESFVAAWARAAESMPGNASPVVTDAVGESLDQLIEHLLMSRDSGRIIPILILSHNFTVESADRLHKILKKSPQSDRRLKITVLGSAHAGVDRLMSDIKVYATSSGIDENSVMPTFRALPLLLNWLRADTQIEALARLVGFEPTAVPEIMNKLSEISAHRTPSELLEEFLKNDIGISSLGHRTRSTFTQQLDRVLQRFELANRDLTITSTQLNRVRRAPRRLSAGYSESVGSALVGLDPIIQEVSDRVLAFLGGGYRRTHVLPMLFVGQSGTGKTSLARLFAEETGAHTISLPLGEWPSEEEKIDARINTEIRDPIVQARLAGQSYSVVILDEVDKRPEILAHLLPLFSSTDAQSLSSTLKGTVFILTSNILERTEIGSRFLTTAPTDPEYEARRTRALIETFMTRTRVASRTVQAFLDRLPGRIFSFAPLTETQSRTFVDHLLHTIQDTHGIRLKLAPSASERLERWYQERRALNPRALEREILEEIEFALTEFFRGISDTERRRVQDPVLLYRETREAFEVNRLSAVPELARTIFSQKTREKLESIRLTLNQWASSVDGRTSIEIQIWRDQFLRVLERSIMDALEAPATSSVELEAFPWPNSLSRSRAHTLESQAHAALMTWVKEGAEGADTSSGREHIRKLITQVWTAVEFGIEEALPDGSPALDHEALARETARHLIQAVQMAVEESIRNLEHEARLQSRVSESALSRGDAATTLEIPAECEAALSYRNAVLRRFRNHQ